MGAVVEMWSAMILHWPGRCTRLTGKDFGEITWMDSLRSWREFSVSFFCCCCSPIPCFAINETSSSSSTIVLLLEVELKVNDSRMMGLESTDAVRPKNDKGTILADSISVVNELRLEIERLKSEKVALTAESQDVSGPNVSWSQCKQMDRPFCSIFVPYCGICCVISFIVGITHVRIRHF